MSGTAENNRLDEAIARAIDEGRAVHYPSALYGRPVIVHPDAPRHGAPRRTQVIEPGPVWKERAEWLRTVWPNEWVDVCATWGLKPNASGGGGRTRTVARCAGLDTTSRLHSDGWHLYVRATVKEA